MSTNVFLEGIELLDHSSYSTSTLCSLCGNFTSPSSYKPLSNCHLCGNTFCKSHLIKTRPDPSNPNILHPFCEKCERSFICKLIYDDFIDQKICLEHEIADLKNQDFHLEEELIVKKETTDGIRKSKDKLIEDLTNEALNNGQEIEKTTQENRLLDKQSQMKSMEKESLLKELERIDILIKELSESQEEFSPSGYEYIWGDGLLKRKDTMNRKKPKSLCEEGVCGYICSLRRLC